MGHGVSFQMSSSRVVRLPESFRGGCSFGAGAWPVSPDATVVQHIGRKHGAAKPVNATRAAINGSCGQESGFPTRFLDSASTSV